MRKWYLCCLACLVAAPSWSWGQDDVFIVKDKKGGVVFTDRPQTIESEAGQSVERVELNQPNIAQPMEVRPRINESASEETPAIPLTVSISAPANETTIAMGPGDFSVSAAVDPPLGRSERLQLLIDGKPYGSAQASASWFVQGALRGPHELIVQRSSGRGETVAVSSPVTVYVLRPSIIRR